MLAERVKSELVVAICAQLNRNPSRAGLSPVVVDLIQMGIQLGQDSKLFLPCLVAGLRQKRVAAGSRNGDGCSRPRSGGSWRFSEFSLTSAVEGDLARTCS